MPSKWQRPETRLLIMLYKKHTNLYDVRQPIYFDRKYRQKCLEQITAKLKAIRPHVNTYDVKNKIRLVRTQYNREMALMEKSMAEGATPDERRYVPNLWCFDQLSFLNDHIRSNKCQPQTSDSDASVEQNTVKAEKFEDPEVEFTLDEDDVAMVESSPKLQQEQIQPEPLPVPDDDNTVDAIPAPALPPPPPPPPPTTNNHKRRNSVNVNERLAKETLELTKEFMRTKLKRSEHGGGHMDRSENDHVVKFIVGEMRQIENPNIRNDVIWKMQEAVREGLLRQRLSSNDNY